MRAGMRGCGVAVVFLWFSVVVCAAEGVPTLPDSFVRLGRVDESGKTWRESGTMGLSLSNAVETLKASFSSQGYVFTHDIADSPESPRRILYWTGPVYDILAMLWRIDDAITGVRWGLSAHGGDFPASRNADGEQRLEPAGAVPVSSSPMSPAEADGGENAENKTTQKSKL